MGWGPPSYLKKCCEFVEDEESDRSEDDEAAELRGRNWVFKVFFGLVIYLIIIYLVRFFFSKRPFYCMLCHHSIFIHSQRLRRQWGRRKHDK